MNATNGSTRPQHEVELHEIRVQGHLDQRWTDWLDGMTVSHHRDGTTTLSLRRATYQIRADAPASQRRVGELVGADLTQGDASVRLEFERVRHISGRVTDTAARPGM